MGVAIDPHDPIQSAFAEEVPEIADGIVEIKRIAREPDNRAVIAVTSNRSDLVDPILACVGEKGERMGRIMNRLAGVKVDIVRWSEIPKELIANAVSRRGQHVQSMSLNHIDRAATIVLEGRSDSLAKVHIRLAEKLTDWKLDIVTSTEKND